MGELVLLVKIAGERVAVRASDVQSVIDLGEITPVPRVPPHIAGLTALRSQALTVIDCAAALGLAQGDNEHLQAVVVNHEGHHYALRVDCVEDVTDAISETTEFSAKLSDNWHRVATGMVETSVGAVVLADIGVLIAGPDLPAAA